MVLTSTKKIGALDIRARTIGSLRH